MVNIIYSIYNIDYCNGIYNSRIDLFPIDFRRPSLVVEVIYVRRFHWYLHLRLLLLLLLETVRDVWADADFILLWVHGCRLLCHVPTAWQHWFPILSVVRQTHLQVLLS